MNMLEALRNLGERAGIDATAIKRMNQVEILRAAAALPDAPGGSDPSNVVWVDQQATGGDGTVGNPWTGWDTAITWSARTEYRFKRGYFSYAASPNFCATGLALVGEAGAVLKYTGSANAIEFIAPAGTWVFGMRMENLLVQGGATADRGIFLSGLRGSIFRNIELRDFTEDGFVTEACVTNVCDTLYLPHDMTTKPKNGVRLTKRAGDGSQTTTWLFLNLIVEAATEKGLHIQNAFWNTFVMGAAENLAGQGMVIDANGAGVINDGNEFIGFDFELNNQVLAGNNVEVRGNSQHFKNCNWTETFRMYAGKRHYIVGGIGKHLTIDNSVTAACLKSLELTGTLSDAGFATRQEGVITAASSGLPLIERMPPCTPTFYNPSQSGGVCNTNVQLANLFYFVAFENFTLNNPTGSPINGMRVAWRIQQDGTGSRLITLGSKFRPGPFTVTLSTVGLKVDYLEAIYNSADDKWDVVNFQKGY